MFMAIAIACYSYIYGFICSCIYLSRYISTHIYRPCVCVCLRPCLGIYIYVSICIYIIFVPVRIYLYGYMYIALSISISMSISISVSISIYTYTYTHLCLHILVSMYTYVYIYRVLEQADGEVDGKRMGERPLCLLHPNRASRYPTNKNASQFKWGQYFLTTRAY